MANLSIPANTTRIEQEIKKSQFITYLGHAANPEQAHAFILAARRQHPGANHACWAFIAGESGNTTNLSCSDDGEPNGTAGKPILNVLQHSGYSEIVAVVMRYFGGIKLGTGGLARAYSGGISEAIKQLPIKKKIAFEEVCFSIEYSLEDSVRRTLESLQARISDLQYSDNIRICCNIPIDKYEDLCTALNDLSRGQVAFHDVD